MGALGRWWGVGTGRATILAATSEGATAGMAVSEYLALEKVKRDETFEGAKNGKYSDGYPAMLQ